MRIVNLIENTEGSSGCLFEHGLSFYIETKKHKMLLDTGASAAFLQNAKSLGIDMGQVDHVILSHGHYDHAGGILDFVKQNQKAFIWLQNTASGEHYRKDSEVEKYIGIDNRITELSQLQFVGESAMIDEGITLFGNISGRKLWPAGNLDLKLKVGEHFFQDDFKHEQCLVVEEDGKRVLLSGCAHNGILNILERYMELYGEEPDVVISGFHTMKKSGYTKADREIVTKIAMELKKWNTTFYTGHCTGEEPFAWMKEYMGEQLTYVHSGDEIAIS